MNWDEVIAEIENLDAPIPAAFLDEPVGQGG